VGQEASEVLGNTLVGSERETFHDEDGKLVKQLRWNFDRKNEKFGKRS
jgi:hypothetical protein